MHLNQIKTQVYEPLALYSNWENIGHPETVFFQKSDLLNDSSSSRTRRDCSLVYYIDEQYRLLVLVDLQSFTGIKRLYVFTED